MNTQTSTHMTIKEAAAHHGVSDKTIRRWIKNGRLNAEHINGRWHVHLNTQQDSVQDTDPPNNPPDVQTPEPNSALVNQMQSEITHLREQLQGRDTQVDHLTKLLAMQTNQNTRLVEQLDPPPPPRPSLYTRFTELVSKLKNGTQNRNSDEHTQK